MKSKLFERRIEMSKALEKQPKPIEKKFPLLGERGNIGSIPWWVAEQAYMQYSNRWRTKCDIIERQAEELKEYQEAGKLVCKGYNWTIEQWRIKNEKLQAELKKLKGDSDVQ